MKLMGKYKGTNVYAISKNEYEERTDLYNNNAMYVVDGKMVFKDQVIGTVDSRNNVDECSPYPYHKKKEEVKPKEEEKVPLSDVDAILKEAMMSLKIDNDIDLQSLMYSGEE